MNYIDHLLVMLVCLLLPVVAYISTQPLMRRIRSGEEIDRNRIYAQTIFEQWGIFVLTLVIWFWVGRDWAQLGFSYTPSREFWIAAALVALVLAMLIVQLHQLKNKSANDLGEIRRDLGGLAKLLPHSRKELLRFYAVSVTAGIVEEALWRGLLLWYLSFYFPVWVAVIIGSIGFGLAHAYQGIRNVPKVAAVGMLLSGVFLLSGSLWLPILLHIVGDMLQGRIAYEINNPGERG